MPKVKRNAGYRVFVDSSVLFAAVLSPSGGSFRIFQEARDRHVMLLISYYVLDEVEGALQEKRPDALRSFRAFPLHFPIEVVSNPRKFVVRKYLDLLPSKDAPILAAAAATKATHLLTLDRKHFLIPLQDVKLPFVIMTPADFIQKYFV